MKVMYTGAELVAVAPHSFTDKMGVEVEYNECVFRIEDDDAVPFVLTLNSKVVKSEQERHTGILEVDVDNEGNRKPKLISFKVE